MDLTSSWVLLLVILLGGGIAVYADRLGRNLGKKRLKLGSLRPRRTAELIVLAAGMLTPLLAILAIMAISAEARQWIAKGYGAVRDARAAVEARDRAIDKYEEALKKAGELDIRLRDQEERLKRALDLSAKYENQARQAQGKAQQALGKVGTLERRVGGLSSEVKARQAALSGVQSDLQRARTALGDIQQKFKLVDRDRNDAYRDIDRLNGEINHLEKQIQSGKGDLEKLRGELAKKQIELNDAEEAKRKAVDALQGELELLNAQLERAANAVAVAQAQLNSAAQRWLFERLIFRIGEEVARLPVRRQLSRSEAERAVESVLRLARGRADSEGAGVNADGVSADIFQTLDAAGNPVTASALKERLIRSLVGQADERVIVARVMANTFANQFVPLDIVSYSNPVVIREGEVLGESRIDSSLPVGQLFEAIGDLLRDQVRRKAEERRLIPIAGKDDAYGSVTPDVIFSLMNSIQAAGRTVRLQVLAKEETRAAGPLLLDFRLR